MLHLNGTYLSHVYLKADRASAVVSTGKHCIIHCLLEAKRNDGPAPTLPSETRDRIPDAGADFCYGTTFIPILSGVFERDAFTLVPEVF